MPKNIEMKQCLMCKNIKSLNCFHKKSDTKDGYHIYCKECRKLQYLENRDTILKKKRKYNLNHPWKIIFNCIQQRCENPKTKKFKWYGGRGIKCLITEEELKFLWFRDKAWLLDQPSIDRKENDGNYEFDNCEFIELIENIKRQNRKKFKKPVIQCNLNGDFIKEWDSARKIEQILGLHHSSIGLCAKGKLKTCGGFEWKYKNEWSN